MNKLWNAARFAFMNLDGAPGQPLAVADLPPEDRWILAELAAVVTEVDAALADYQYSRAAVAVRGFFWDALCDWYLELIKFRLREDHHHGPARQVLALALDQVLRLMHPLAPFITERLWGELNRIVPQRGIPGRIDLSCPPLLATAPYPQPSGYAGLDDPEIRETFRDLQAAIRGVRDIRNAAGLPPRDLIRVTIRTDAARAARLGHEAHIIRRMAGVSDLTIDAQAVRPPGSAVSLVGGLHIFVHDVVDDAAERLRVEQRLADLDQRMRGPEGKLASAGYLKSAAPEVVEETRQILADLRAQRGALQAVLELLQ
jgi:valyl-tRNA synthetase